MRTLLALVITALCLGSCGQGGKKVNKKALNSEISTLQDSLSAADNAKMYKQTAESLSKKLTKYIDHFPDDSLTPDYTYRLGAIHLNYLQKPQEGIDYLDQMLKKFPDHERAPYALFTQALTYEKLSREHGKQQKQQFIDSAKKKYQVFLDQYPDHQLADDAEISKENLGLSAEEQLEIARERRKAEMNAKKDTPAQ